MIRALHGVLGFFRPRVLKLIMSPFCHIPDISLFIYFQFAFLEKENA